MAIKTDDHTVDLGATVKIEMGTSPKAQAIVPIATINVTIAAQGKWARVTVAQLSITLENCDSAAAAMVGGYATVYAMFAQVAGDANSYIDHPVKATSSGEDKEGSLTWRAQVFGALRGPNDMKRTTLITVELVEPLAWTDLRTTAVKRLEKAAIAISNAANERAQAIKPPPVVIAQNLSWWPPITQTGMRSAGLVA